MVQIPSSQLCLLRDCLMSNTLLASFSLSDSRLQIVKEFYSSLTDGTINSGDIGEIVAALVILLSFDRGLSRGTFQPMKLSKFLDFILPDKINQQFVECM